MFPATFLNFGPACSAIFLLWSFGEINQLELSIYLDIYGTLRVNTTLGWVNPVNPKAKGSFRQAFAKPRFWMYHYGTARLMDG